jgi:hypothetical protein
MMLANPFAPVFSSPVEDFSLLPDDRRGKIYVDLPHRFFGALDQLKEYVRACRDMGANVLLLLPHFLPSFSEYVVKDYEQPCRLFGDWHRFAEFMAFVKDLGMDRMIDIPFNHADWQAAHLHRNWFKKYSENGIEAGADDTDADDRRVRINWGAFILDNGNRDLIQYWLEKVIFPHVSEYHVNAIRIDAAWGLDRNGLERIVRGTRERFPQVWFVAENLGMDRLINLAESGLAAGAERYFNNYYWYSGGRYIPSDNYRFRKVSGGKPTCTIFSSHDVLMPAMRAFSRLKCGELGHLNDKALHRQVVEYDRCTSVSQFSIEDREYVLHLMKLDFILSAFLSTDLMWVAGSEQALLERVDVLKSGPEHWSRGVKSDLPSFFTGVLRARSSDELFNMDGVVIPFGDWERGTVGVRGYVKRVGARICLVAANLNLFQAGECPIPEQMRALTLLKSLSPLGLRSGSGSDLGPSMHLEPGQAVILFA